MGLSKLRRDSCALCRAAGRDLEYERAPPDGSIRSGAELRTALCISPDIGGAEDGSERSSRQRHALVRNLSNRTSIVPVNTSEDAVSPVGLTPQMASPEVIEGFGQRGSGQGIFLKIPLRHR